ncbi:MAG TPA: hypothetical protein VIM98_11155 [Dyella sp.]|uniref:hypothetical protein n=1 Tax=Dyella sp. TaxID=1869338 RepID=UPI002F924F6B
MNHRSTIRVSSDFILSSIEGQENLLDPLYTLTASMVVTDDDNETVPGVTMRFRIPDLGGGRVQFFGMDRVEDNEGLTAWKDTDDNGVAEVKLCGYASLFIYLFGSIDGSDSTTQFTLVCSNEAEEGSLEPPTFLNEQDGELAVQNPDYSFQTKAPKALSNAHDSDPCAIVVNRRLAWLGLYGRLSDPGAQVPYNALEIDDSPVANNMYYFATPPGAATTYKSQLATFGVNGVPTARPNPEINGDWEAPRPYPSGTIDDNALKDYVLTFHVPLGQDSSKQLKPRDKVTFWIYVNGWTAGSIKSKKAYTRSFSMIVPDDYDPDDQLPLTLTLSAQYFYNFSRGDDNNDDNKIYFNYQVNDSGWSKAWSGIITTDPV